MFAACCAKCVQDNLSNVPSLPSSTWLQQLIHLGVGLARIQAMMVALPTKNGPDAAKVCCSQPYSQHPVLRPTRHNRLSNKT